MVIGYVDKENQYASSEVKFGIAIGSIIPLSYYIGMGIARWVVSSTLDCGFSYTGQTWYTYEYGTGWSHPWSFHRQPLSPE